MVISSGMNRVDAEVVGRKLGAKIEFVRGTGDLKFTHPKMSRHVIMHGARKDSTRAVTQWLRRLQQALSLVGDRQCA